MRHNLLQFNFKELIFRDIRITQEQFSKDVEKISKSILTKMEENSSPFVYLMSDNTYKAVVYYFAIIKAKKIAVLIDPDTTDFELNDFIEIVPPCGIICPENTEIFPDFERDSFIYTSTDIFVNKEELDGVCTMMFTNAEDGHIKAVKITFHNIESSIRSCKNIDTFPENCVMSSILPYYHIFGLMSGPIYGTRSGGKLIIYEMSRVLDTTAMLNAFLEHKLTNLYSVPMVYYLLAKSPKAEALNRSLVSAVAGGYKLDYSISNAFVKRTNVVLREGYGLTESTGITFGFRIGIDTIKQDSVGKASNELEAKIVDNFGNEVENGLIGEVLLSGKGVINGFYNNPSSTSEYFREGWLATGDNGFFDEEGYLFITGLKKRMLNVAGKNVYPAELERFIIESGLASACYVYGEYSGIFGHKVVAEIQLKVQNSENEMALKQWCKTNISAYKLPKRWEFKELSSPQTASPISQIITDKESA